MSNYRTYFGVDEVGFAFSSKPGGVQLDVYSPGPPKRLIVRDIDFDQLRILRDWIDERLKEAKE